MAAILFPFLSRYVGPAPTGIRLSPASIVENAAAGADVGNLIIEPEGLGIAGVLWTVGNSKFELSAASGTTVTLRRSAAGTLTGGVDESVLVTVLDRYGQSASRTFTVVVTAAESAPDVAPTIIGQSIEVSASAALGAVVATSIVTNTPSPAGLTKTIVSGNGAGAFGVSGLNTVVADATALAALVGTTVSLGTKVANGVAPDATATESISVVENADTVVSAATIYNYGAGTLADPRGFLGLSFVDGDMPADSYPVLKDSDADVPAKVSAVTRFASGAMRYCRMEYAWAGGSIAAGGSKAMTVAARVGTYADAAPISKAATLAAILAAEGGYEHAHDLGSNGNADDGVWTAGLAHALGGAELNYNTGTGGGTGFADKDRGHRFLSHNAVFSLVECFTYVRNTVSAKYHHFIKTKFWVIYWHGTGLVQRTGMTLTDRMYGASDDATHGGRTTPQSYLYDATVADSGGTIRSYAGQTSVAPHFRHGFRAGWFGCGDDPRAWDMAPGSGTFPTCYAIQDPAYVALQTGIVPYPLIAGVTNAADGAITYKPFFDDSSLLFSGNLYDVVEYDNTVGHPVAEKIFRAPGDANTFRKMMAIGFLPAAHPIFTSIYETGLLPNILNATTGMAVLGSARSTASWKASYDASANQMAGGTGKYGSWNVTAQVDSWNIAHYPEYSATPYVVTGDPRFLFLLEAYSTNTQLVANPSQRRLTITGNEGTEASAGTAIYGAWSGRAASQGRVCAWANRSHFNAARLTPDNDPHKALLTALFANSVSYMRQKYPNMTATARAIGYWGINEGVGATQARNNRAFQKEYLGMVFGWIAAAGDIGSADALDWYENHFRKWYVRRFLDTLTSEDDRYFVVNYEHTCKLSETIGTDDFITPWSAVIDATKLGHYGGTGSPTGFNGANGPESYDGSARAGLWMAQKAGITGAAAALAVLEARMTWADSAYNNSNYAIRFAYGRGS